MLDLHESIELRGSSGAWYRLKNVGGVLSCTCPAWRNQSQALDLRSCKHLVEVFGAEAERARTGGAPARARPSPGDGGGEGGKVEGRAPPLLLAHAWDGERALDGWWMSEKLDGVRAYWDGAAFVSRLGNTYLAPDWFTAQLPAVTLDGELWVGRKRFQRTISIVRRQDRSDDWREVRFVVFDAPDHRGTFEERVSYLRATLVGLERVELLAQERLEDLAHLRRELARVEALGGEGLMLREPGSRYAVGRSSTLLKVKSFHDAEAKVVAHLAGAGKHKGRLGALLVETQSGVRFSVGTGFSDREREDPPAVGAIITYRYQELSEGGVPRFPTFVAERHDFNWDARG
jgi:DNA ligase-1